MRGAVKILLLRLSISTITIKIISANTLVCFDTERICKQKESIKRGVVMTEEKSKMIENSLNELIAEAVKNSGHVYVVDMKQNTFALKLTEPIKIHFYGGYKGVTE